MKLKSRAYMIKVFSFLIVLLTISPNVKVQAQSNRPRADLDATAALIRENRFKEAEQQLRRIMRSHPNDPLALNLLGTIRAQQGRVNDAQRLFLQALRIDQQFVGARLNLVHLFAVTRQPEKEISELMEVLRLDPKSPDVLARLVELLTAQGRFDEAITSLEKTKQTGLLTTDLLVELGDMYLKMDQPEKAEENYRMVLTADAANTDAVLGLAGVYQFRGDLEKAKIQLSLARKMAAPSPETLYRFALTSINSGFYEDANRALQAAIELRPDQPAYFVALGTTWVKKPDFLAAEQAFRRALQLQPENVECLLYLGYSLLEQKKYVEARSWLEKSLARDQRTPETFYYLGLISQEENDDEVAIGLFKKALDLSASYSVARTALGASYLRQKNYALAKEELESSVKLDPKDPRTHYNLALLYARLKDPERAQAEMKIVEELKNAKRGKPTQQNETLGVPPR